MDKLEMLIARRESQETAKRVLKDRLKIVEDQIQQTDTELIQRLMDSGLTKMATETFTYYLQHTKRASARSGTEFDIATELEVEGLGSMVSAPTVHHARLQAWVKELPEDDEGNTIFPSSGIEKCVNVYNQTLLRLRKK